MRRLLIIVSLLALAACSPTPFAVKPGYNVGKYKVVSVEVVENYSPRAVIFMHTLNERDSANMRTNMAKVLQEDFKDLGQDPKVALRVEIYWGEMDGRKGSNPSMGATLILTDVKTKEEIGRYDVAYNANPTTVRNMGMVTVYSQKRSVVLDPQNEILYAMVSEIKKTLYPESQPLKNQ